MATFSGLVLSGVTPAPPEELSASISGYPGVSVVGPMPVGTVSGNGPLSRNSPRPALPAQLGGVATYTFANDLYNRVYLSPSNIDVGNLTGTISRDIEIWNAFLVPETCTAFIAETLDGITFNAATGFVLAPLGSRTIRATFLMDGPPIISGRLRMQFGALEVSVSFAGRRIVAWVWRPDAPMTETLEWLTEIIESRDGSEQRRRLRNAPRQGFDVQVTAPESVAQVMDTAVYGWQARSWAMPMWAEQAVVATPLAAGATSVAVDATASDYRAGGLAMLWQSETVNEVLQVQAVAAGLVTFALPTTVAFTARTVLMPVRTARMTGPARRDDNAAGHAKFSASFIVTDNADLPGAAAPVQYAGYDVLLDALYTQGGVVRRDIDRPVEAIDFGKGIWTVDSPRDYSTAAYEMRWRLRNGAASWALRGWLHRRAGRLLPFWMPTWRGDLQLLATVGPNDATIRVADTGYARLLQGAPVRAHLMVELTDGTRLYRAVQAAATGSAGEELLTLATPFGREVAPAAVRRICWLVLCRLNADRISVEWRRAGVAWAVAPVKEVAA